MSETKVLQQVAMLRDIAATPEILATAKKHGIRILPKHIPVNEREAFTIRTAAAVYGVDYRILLERANQGLIPVFRPLSRRGTPGRRHIRRSDMEHFISQFYE